MARWTPPPRIINVGSEDLYRMREFCDVRSALIHPEDQTLEIETADGVSISEVSWALLTQPTTVKRPPRRNERFESLQIGENGQTWTVGPAFIVQLDYPPQDPFSPVVVRTTLTFATTWSYQ